MESDTKKHQPGAIRLRAALVRLFFLPGRILDLPLGHPHRFFAAQVILYVGVGIILLGAVLRSTR